MEQNINGRAAQLDLGDMTPGPYLLVARDISHNKTVSIIIKQ